MNVGFIFRQNFLRSLYLTPQYPLSISTKKATKLVAFFVETKVV